MRVKLGLLFSVLFLIALVGCLESRTETYGINGADQNLSLKFDKPTVLNINGSNNFISIENDANIVEISINGTDNTIKIPNNLIVPIKQNGSGNKIERI